MYEPGYEPVPADGIVWAQNKCEIRKCLTYWGGDRKNMNKFKKCVVTPAFYVMKWKWQAYSTRDKFLVVSKRYLDCILAEPEEGCQTR